QWITREIENSSPFVVKSEGEHASKPVEAPRAPAPPSLEDNLRIGAGLEFGTAGTEVGRQFTEVVDLAIIGDHEPVLPQRLIGAVRQIDDRKAAMPERECPVDRFPALAGGAIFPLGIGPPMLDGIEHCPQDPRSSVPSNVAYDAAH